MSLNSNSFKAVIFDLDGTLLDTLVDLANSMNSVLKRYGYPMHPTEDYKYLAGGGVEELVIKALPDKATDKKIIEKIKNDLLQEYELHCCDTTHPYEGVSDLLYSLYEKRIRTAVLSNKQDRLTKLMIRRLLPIGKFEIVLGMRDNIPKKPDPTSAIEIASMMKLSREEFIFLGDSSIDMQTALSAGMYPIGALWGFRTKEELLTAGAKALIEKPLELMNFFI